MKRITTRAMSLAATASLALSACHSLDSPSYPGTGGDARVYNPQTGRFEWPERDAQPAGPDRRRISSRDEPRGAPTRGGADERTYHPQTGRWEQARE